MLPHPLYQESRHHFSVEVRQRPETKPVVCLNQKRVSLEDKRVPQLDRQPLVDRVYLVVRILNQVSSKKKEPHYLVETLNKHLLRVYLVGQVNNNHNKQLHQLACLEDKLLNQLK